jgi:3-hydroxyacyl-[acyl-carrier-protein] dehydratase
MSGGVNLDISKILKILPHRTPFLLIDRVTDLEPRKSARGIKCVTYNEPFFPGHFPGTPMFPGFLCLEAMGQLMCILAYASESIDTNQQLFYVMGVENAKFRHSIIPGDQVEIHVEVLNRRSNIWKCKGSARVGEVLCVEGTLLAAITDRDEPVKM